MKPKGDEPRGGGKGRGLGRGRGRCRGRGRGSGVGARITKRRDECDSRNYLLTSEPERATPWSLLQKSTTPKPANHYWPPTPAPLQGDHPEEEVDFHNPAPRKVPIHLPELDSLTSLAPILSPISMSSHSPTPSSRRLSTVSSSMLSSPPRSTTFTTPNCSPCSSSSGFPSPKHYFWTLGCNLPENVVRPEPVCPGPSGAQAAAQAPHTARRSIN